MDKPMTFDELKEIAEICRGRPVNSTELKMISRIFNNYNLRLNKLNDEIKTELL